VPVSSALVDSQATLCCGINDNPKLPKLTLLDYTLATRPEKYKEPTFASATHQKVSVIHICEPLRSYARYIIIIKLAS